MPNTPEPGACRHCPLTEREHMQRWTRGVGWHTWTQPTQQQIKDRMQARAAAARAREEHHVSDELDAAFTNACEEAAASIDRQFQWMPPRVARPVATTELSYEACRDLVDAAHRERHGLRRRDR